MGKHLEDKQLQALIEAILALETEEEALSFFEDIFTVREMQSIAQRLAVASLLRKKVTYQEIAERTGSSTATISRVNHSLSYGAGGYHRVLAKLDRANEDERNGNDHESE